MNWKIRLLISIPIWILFLIIRLVLILLGWIMIPIAIITNSIKYEESRAHKGGRMVPVFKSLFWLWSNADDGIDAAMEFPDKPTWFRILYWNAFRNPANNLRYVPFLSVKIDPKKIAWIGSRPGEPEKYDRTPPEAEWYFCYQGLYSNFWWQFKMFGSIWRFWIGWKIHPFDYKGVPVGNYRHESAGFATQFKKLRWPRW